MSCELIALRSIDPARKRARWYTLNLQLNLFGTIDVVARWGRVGCSGGAEQWRTFATEGQALDELTRILNRRRTHGYTPAVGVPR